MKTKFFYLTLFMFCSFGLLAQKGAVKASLTSQAVYMKEIPALSSMKNIISAKGIIKHGREKQRGKNNYVPGKGLPKVGESDPLMKYQQKSMKAAISTEVANFVAHQGNSTPTDPTGAIGPNHYVYAFNSGFGIRDRNGSVLLAEASLATIFPGEDLGDPIVVYDNYAERFIIMQFSNSPNGILIAIGKGPDPVNDGWYTYRFNTGEFPDYEKLSIWSDGYYITSNKAPNGAIGTLETVYVAERDKMLAGDASAGFVGFTLPGAISSGFYSPAGFNATGPTLPPVGTGNSFIYLQDDSWSGVSSDHLKIWTTDVNWSNPSSSTISQPVEVTTSPFDSVFDGGSFSNLPQPSGGDIDALQATMMYMTNYRRFATHNSVVLNFVVDLNGNDDLAGIRWYELRQTGDGQPWTIHQEGTYTQPDGHSAFCGAIAMDGQGNIGLGYTVVSNSIVPSIRYTGRLASDPSGTMTLTEQVAVNGTQSNPSTRYGDYAQMTVDPSDDATFWHIAEYFDAGFRKNHVVAYKLQPDTPDTEAPTVPANLTASNTTDVSTSLSWDASTDNVGVTAYDVYQDGTVVATVATTTADITGLTASTSYDFSVKAKDAAGNESAASATLTVTTVAPDTQAPTVPANLTASNTSAGQTTLSWDASTDNVGVAGYDVLQDGAVVATVTTTTTVVAGLSPETTYEFKVLAKDAAGNESATSTPISVTTPAATGCLNGVAVPYSESFESDFGGWTQASGDDLDWTRDSGGTPSNNTGPSSADDGSTYIYVEASGNGTGYPNKRAILNSPCVDLSGATAAVFSFSYHMYGGTDFGSLDVEASNDDGATWTSIWSKSGNQGNSWQTATIDLAAYLGVGLQLRFNRVTGNTWQADAAIDKISLTSDTTGNCATGDLTLSITFDNYPEETSWTLTDAGGTTVASKSYSTANPDGSTVTETINALASGSYTFTISDSFGDGICCSYGNGSYTLSSSAGTIASGGEFTNSDATEFCAQGSSVRLDTYELTDFNSNDKRFMLYPNPTKGILNISVGKTPIQKLEIFSMFGQKVRSIDDQGIKQIDVSNLTAGTYFARITAKETIVTRSFIVAK
ncbi:chitodextrinase [Aquimarina sp. EL_43]|uniref:fibronectin type III domain-containing protein n=1 Tax=Aquimarina TaxID=290174 RepID=UPI000472E9A2|nr:MULTISPECIES: T9SS type A sorting domain-containing protein [Aquimarina]MBG6131338.1 chitodextrinase [Aquimarina sp. EL_35]MBG6151779.1 chitodextrinase [Aquimarina sp. EL_32]MBG6169709.1 chitodextrinase [Aquimarina sp. EL_43]